VRMRASVMGRVDPAVDAVQRDRLVADHHPHRAALRDCVFRSDLVPFTAHVEYLLFLRAQLYHSSYNSMMRNIVYVVATLLAGALTNQALAAEPPTKPDAEITLKIGEHKLTAEVVVTDATRERGLMYRSSMPDNRGMLFVFAQSSFHSMWMKNT